MAKTVNRHGAPESLVAFAKEPHYDSGDSDFTVTQLIDSPRVRILREKHSDEIQDDVYENIFRLVGTAIHHIAEQHPGRTTSEERIFIEVDGKRISGAIDVQRFVGEAVPSPANFAPHWGERRVVIGDYKFTSVMSLKFPEKFEAQLNLYCLLRESAGGPDVSGLEVYAILRDWSFRKAQQETGYPKTPGVTLKVKQWERARQQSYLAERLEAHISADTQHELGGDIPECTPEETWEKPTIYALKSHKRDKAAKQRGGNSRAVRLFEDVYEAMARCKADEDLFIEVRPGERTRCEHFCDVSIFCNQWKEYSGENDERI